MGLIDLHLDNLHTVLRCSNATPVRNNGVFYICGYCDARFVKPVDLKVHTMNKHAGCLFKLRSLRSMTEYIVKLDITDLKCNHCGSDIDSLESLLDHLSNDHSETIHTHIKNHMMPFKFDSETLRCAICNIQFYKFKMLLQHMNSHYDNYVCDECGAGFVTYQRLRMHIKRHADGVHTCRLCDAEFDTESKLKAHIQNVHIDNRRHRCAFCDERFVSLITKNNHMVREHGAEPITFKCTACEKTFTNFQSLSIHRKMFHLLERRHDCQECTKTFYSTNQLKKHMLTHTGVKEFECKICCKRYGRRSTLKEHLRIHANERRFKCELCGMAFVQKCSLRGHMRSKHGEEL